MLVSLGVLVLVLLTHRVRLSRQLHARCPFVSAPVPFRENFGIRACTVVKHFHRKNSSRIAHFHRFHHVFPTITSSQCDPLASFPNYDHRARRIGFFVGTIGASSTLTVESPWLLALSPVRTAASATRTRFPGALSAGTIAYVNTSNGSLRMEGTGRLCSGFRPAFPHYRVRSVFFAAHPLEPATERTRSYCWCRSAAIRSARLGAAINCLAASGCFHHCLSLRRNMMAEFLLDTH